MQSYADCPFFSTTIVGACIDVMATDLPRCSTMPNTTPMNVTLYDGQYQVWFSTTSSSEGKQIHAGQIFRGTTIFKKNSPCHWQLHALFFSPLCECVLSALCITIKEFIRKINSRVKFCGKQDFTKRVISWLVFTRNACNEDLIGFVKLCSVVMDAFVVETQSLIYLLDIC